MPIPFTVTAVESALLGKGMERDANHHWMYRRTLAGVTTLVTRISHGCEQVDRHNAHLMANQCCLQLAEFVRLVECTLGQADWDALVRERCSGGRNPFLGR